MTTKTAVWGNGLGLHLPKAIVQKAGLEAGTELELSLQIDGSLLVQPIKTAPCLKDLLTLIDPKEIPTNVWEHSRSIGREIW